jgi:hypothetical protein
MSGLFKKWWFWVGLIVVIGIAANKNGGSSSGESSGTSSENSQVVNGVGKITYSVPKSIAGEKNMAFKEVTDLVFNMLKDNPDVKTLDITMQVECEDIYGKWSTKESHVTVDNEDVLEMRKFAGPSNLSDDCMDWQLRFEVGYKMCGQID